MNNVVNVLHQELSEMIEIEEKLISLIESVSLTRNSQNHHSVEENTFNFICMLRDKHILEIENSIMFRQFLVLLFSFIAINKEQVDLIFNIFFLLKNEMLNTFQEDQILSFISRDKSYILFFLESGILNLNTIIENIKDSKNSSMFKYFFPEILAADKAFFYSYIESHWEKDVIKQFILSEGDDTFVDKVNNDKEEEEEKEFKLNITSELIENYKEKRKLFHSNEIISKYIRDDNIDEFINIVNISNIDISTFTLNYSFYETNHDRYSNYKALIEYAAVFGAIKIFNFLFLNKVKMTENLNEAVIVGGNYEIINLLEDKGVNFYTRKCVMKAIQYHRNDVYDYIMQNFKYKHLKEKFKIFSITIDYSNYYVLKQMIFGNDNDNETGTDLGVNIPKKENYLDEIIKKNNIKLILGKCRCNVTAPLVNYILNFVDYKMQ